MKKTSKKGMTLTSLITTVVIALLLIATITVSYNSIKNSTRKKEFGKEIYTLQKVIEQYKFMNNKYPVTEEYTFNLSKIDSKYKNQFSSEDGFDTNSITLSQINLYEAGVETITRGLKQTGEDDLYLLSEKTGKVYYVKGESIGDNIYYTLVDELKKEIGFK